MSEVGEEDHAREVEGSDPPKKEKKEIGKKLNGWGWVNSEKRILKLNMFQKSRGWVSLKRTWLITVPRWGAGHGVMFPPRREGISNCGLAVAATPAG